MIRQIIAAGLAAAGLLLAGCTTPAAPPHQAQDTAGTPAGAPGTQAAGTRRAAGPPGTQAAGVLRLGMTEDAADAPALLGWQLGYFGQNLGKVTLQPAPFTSTAAEVTALQDGQLDAAYLDPVAALQAWQATRGGLFKIVAGAASGGAELVVAPSVTSPAQLRGRKLAAPAGGAQQAAADHWLRQHHLPALTAAEASASAGPAVLQDFRSGKIAGAWEPPPLDAQLVAAGGRVLVNEASLWPGGQFPTAVLVVTRAFLAASPRAVTALLKGQLQASRLLTASPASAAAAIAQRLTALGNPLPPRIITQSISQLTYTQDPLPRPLLTEARQAAATAMLTPPGNLAGIFDLRLLNQVLKEAGQPQVSA